jgi:hypothetical protein
MGINIRISLGNYMVLKYIGNIGYVDITALLLDVKTSSLELLFSFLG